MEIFAIQIYFTQAYNVVQQQSLTSGQYFLLGRKSGKMQLEKKSDFKYPFTFQ